MSIDLSLTITNVIALSAIISPVITCLIDNHYKSKRDHVQNYELAKRETLNHFIKSANEYHQATSSSSRISAFNSSICALYMYFPNVPKEVHSLEQIEYSQFNPVLNKITIELAKQIKKK